MISNLKARLFIHIHVHVSLRYAAEQRSSNDYHKLTARCIVESPLLNLCILSLSFGVACYTKRQREYVEVEQRTLPLEIRYVLIPCKVSIRALSQGVVGAVNHILRMHLLQR